MNLNNVDNSIFTSYAVGLDAGSLFRQTSTTLPASSKIICTNESIKVPTETTREDVTFSGSLADVYERALNNVMSIKPSFKMDENQNDTILQPDKRSLEETSGIVPTSGKHSESYKSRLHQGLYTKSKLTTENKSAFHVPEKRHMVNGKSRYRNWSREYQWPYTFNHPGDYYPFLQPSTPIYSGYRSVPVERFGYIPEQRRRELPVYTHLMPWSQLERDNRPMRSTEAMFTTSSRFCDTTSKFYNGKIKLLETKKIRSEENVENSADIWLERPNFQHSAEANSHKNDDFNNVKTRRMRADEKKLDISHVMSKVDFKSPKEEFFYSLGLTKIDK